MLNFANLNDFVVDILSLCSYLCGQNNLFYSRKCKLDGGECNLFTNELILITPRSRFDNTLYFDITLTPNGVIVL